MRVSFMSEEEERRKEERRGGRESERIPIKLMDIIIYFRLEETLYDRYSAAQRKRKSTWNDFIMITQRSLSPIVPKTEAIYNVLR